MSQTAKSRAIPYEIFVVETEEGFRIYTSKGQATNWAIKQKGKIHRYINPQLECKPEVEDDH